MEILSGHAADYAALVIVAGYVASVVRNWRPIRSLRDENRDLRAILDEQKRRYDALELKYEDLEKRYGVLEKSRDFQTAFDGALRAIDQARADASHEHEKLLDALEAHERNVEKAWTEIGRSLAANTSALGALAAGINAGTIPPGGAT